MEIKNIEDLYNFLNKKERENGVFSILMFKKIPIWAYLRPNLIEFAYKKYNLSENVAPIRKFTFLIVLRTIFSGIKSFFLQFKKRKAEFWFFETSRRIGGKEPYCQPIYERINKNRYKKFCYSEKWSYEKGVLYLNFMKLVIMMISILLSPFLHFFLGNKRNVLDSTVKSIIGDNSFSYNQKYIECALWYIFFLFNVKIGKPKKVFIVSNTFFIPLIAVCDKYGIETIEIQHGVISRYSVNYNFERMSRKWFFPNRVLLLGKGWEFMKDYFPNGVETNIIGSKNIKNSKVKKRIKRESILIISQKPIRKYLISFMNKNETTLLDCKIIFKLHPMEYNSKELISKEIPKLLQKNVTIIADEKSLNVLQEEITCQIGVYSTGILEGVQLNIPTLLVKTPLSNHVDFLKELNIRTTPLNKEELKSFIRMEKASYNVEYFSEFLKNTVDEIINV